MAEKLAAKRNDTATGPAYGINVTNRHTWTVEAAANGDTVLIGELPGGHRLLPEACSVIANAAAPAMTIDVYVDTPASTLFDNVAIAGGAFARQALTAFAVAEAIGVSPLNRNVYLLLQAAPAANGGQVSVVLTSYPSE